MTDAANAEGQTPAPGVAAPEQGTPTPEGTVLAEGQQQGNEPNSDGAQDGNADTAEGEGAPEKYEFTAPEGMELDQSMVEQFTPIAKELNLTQEQAQKLVDLHNQSVSSTIEAQAAEWNKTMKEWVDEIKQDKEIGGQVFDENIGIARGVLEKYATPGLREVLETSGMGNHPEVVRFITRIGKAMQDDSIRTGNTATGAPKDPAHVLFPNHK